MLRGFTIRSTTLLGHRSITSARHVRHGDISGAIMHANTNRKPSRGGQNLSSRWERLEKSIREKASLSKEVEDFGEHDASLPMASQPAPTLKASENSVPLFYGFKVPEEPKPPADDECCMSGCAVCVYDLHEEALDAYNESVKALRAALSSRHIPVAEWPAHIRPKESTSTNETTSRKDTILNAFEEMERKLASKKVEEKEEITSNSSDLTHWRQRQHLASIKKAESRDSLFTELYEMIRWVVFSNR